jgi:hypothetical protein
VSIDNAAAGADDSTGATGASSAGPLAAERVAALAAIVDEVTALPLAEHAEVYQRVHVELQAALAHLDSN